MRRYLRLTLPHFGIPDQSRGQRLAWYLAAVGGIAATTVLIGLARPYARPDRLQIGYLLVVLAVAIGGGSGPALFACLLAFLSFDWFFVAPVGTPAIAAPGEWLALLLFVTVAVSTGSLAAGLTRSRDDERRRSHELAVLYELSIRVLAVRRSDQLHQLVVQRLAEALGLNAALLLDDGDGRPRLVAQSGLSDEEIRLCDTALAAARGTPASATNPTPARMEALTRAFADRSLRVICSPLTTADRSLGIVVAFAGASLRSAPQTRRVLDAFAAQTAIAVDRARLAEEEERARAATESDRLKSVFLASLSHDLRTPLSVMKAAVGVLTAETTSPAARETLAALDDEVDRLNRLLGNLLDLSRIEGDGLRLRRAPEDLAEIVGATMERLAPLLAERPIVLRGAELPLLDVDAPQLERVFLNVLENASKFSPPDAPITVDLLREHDEAIVRVHNVGAPIPIAEQRRIFEKFYRLRGSNPGVDGAGLGLAICKGIVEAHGGRIWTHNESTGVAFYIALPIPATASAVAEPSAVAVP